MNDALRTRAQSAPVCFLCGSAGEWLYEDLEDRLFGAAGRWGLRRCTRPECESVWLDPMPLPEDLALAYRHYYTHASGESDATDRRPSKVLRHLLEAALWGPLGVRRERRRLERLFLDPGHGRRLLDVGCGNGHRLVLLHRLGWRAEGQEVDPEAARRAAAIARDPVHLGPLESLGLPGETFDAVVMNHVLEHVSDPVGLLRECHRLLKPEGRLVSATPNVASWGHRRFGRDWRGLEPPRHLHLFTPRSLLRLATRAGFDRAEVWTTAANAESFARASLALRHPDRATGWRPAAQGFLFQVRATVRHRNHRDSGEECVLSACR